MKWGGHALEAPLELLPFLPELLADLDKLGSDAERITHVLRDLQLPPAARVVDLGCGKGAITIEIASVVKLHVVGIELFEPLVAQATAAAQAAGVSHLCEFRHGDIRAVPGVSPFDVAVFAGLGDVLGTPAETMSVFRQFVRLGGHVLVADVFLRDGGTATFPGFEHYRPRTESVKGLTAWGDVLVTEVVEEAERHDDGRDDEAAAIHRRAVALATRHPEHRAQLLAFAAHQAAANAHIAENLWMPSGCCVGQTRRCLVTAESLGQARVDWCLERPS